MPAIDVVVQVGTSFPSRLHVSNGRLFDANNHNVGILKGFNVHVASVVGQETFVWSQQDYTDMHTAGARIVRHVIHWDVFEQSSGTFNATALASLDTAIARAKAAGMYTLLSAPQLNGNRVPAWAQTTGGEWGDFMAHGQGLVQTLATRYKNEKAVIGINPNEPPIIALNTLQANYATFVGWYSGIATGWPVWAAISAYGNGTPYPNSGTQAVTATIAALDVNGNGVILEWHDYLNLAGSYSADSYQPNGSISPLQQVGATGAQYHGWGGNYNYPNTVQSRADFAAHIAPHVLLRDANPRFALAVAEFGIDATAGNALQSGDPAFVADKAACYGTARAVVQMWWAYDVAALSSDPFSARPGGTWRPSILTWLGT